jgi:hypothetical protein
LEVSAGVTGKEFNTRRNLQCNPSGMSQMRRQTLQKSRVAAIVEKMTQMG